MDDAVFGASPGAGSPPAAADFPGGARAGATIRRMVERRARGSADARHPRRDAGQGAHRPRAARDRRPARSLAGRDRADAGALSGSALDEEAGHDGADPAQGTRVAAETDYRQVRLT